MSKDQTLEEFKHSNIIKISNYLKKYDEMREDIPSQLEKSFDTIYGTNQTLILKLNELSKVNGKVKGEVKKLSSENDKFLKVMNNFLYK